MLLITMLGCNAITAIDFCLAGGATTVVNIIVPGGVSGGKVVFKQQKQAEDPWCLAEFGNSELYSFEVKSDELYGISSQVRTEPIGFEDLQKHANVAHVQLPVLQSAECYRHL